MLSFHDWLRSAQEAPEADRLAMLIAQAGAAGVSLDRLRRVVGLLPETLADVLKALVAGGQVRLLKVGGKTVYRAAGCILPAGQPDGRSFGQKRRHLRLERKNGT